MWWGPELGAHFVVMDGKTCPPSSSSRAPILLILPGEDEASEVGATMIYLWVVGHGLTLCLKEKLGLVPQRSLWGLDECELPLWG